MGFNKTYLSKDIIKQIVYEDGLEYLINFIRKQETVITEDKFSEKVYSMINEFENKFILLKLIELGLYNG